VWRFRGHSSSGALASSGELCPKHSRVVLQACKGPPTRPTPKQNTRMRRVSDIPAPPPGPRQQPPTNRRASGNGISAPARHNTQQQEQQPANSGAAAPAQASASELAQRLRRRSSVGGAGSVSGRASGNGRAGGKASGSGGGRKAGGRARSGSGLWSGGGVFGGMAFTGIAGSADVKRRIRQLVTEHGGAVLTDVPADEVAY